MPRLSIVSRYTHTHTYIVSGHLPPDASLSLAVVLAGCTWPLNFFLEGKFTMSVWAFAFPLDALAAAAVTVYGYTRFDTMQV